MFDASKVVGFDWDEGNARKSKVKHNVSQFEAEQVFFNDPLLVVPDQRQDYSELRLHALGKTDLDRLLHLTFTLRAENALIRVISARDMYKKERAVMSKPKTTPVFYDEQEERTFWEVNDSSAHIDWGKAEKVTLSNLKPSTKTISLRLPESLLERIKIEANKRDMPYQSLIKAWLAEDVKEHSL